MLEKNRGSFDCFFFFVLRLDRKYVRPLCIFSAYVLLLHLAVISIMTSLLKPVTEA